MLASTNGGNSSGLSRLVAFNMVGSISNDRIAADTGAVLDRLPSLPDARPGKVGLIGYCMTRPRISAAALLVKVMARIDPGCARR